MENSELYVHQQIELLQEDLRDMTSEKVYYEKLSIALSNKLSKVQKERKNSDGGTIETLQHALEKLNREKESIIFEMNTNEKQMLNAIQMLQEENESLKSSLKLFEQEKNEDEQEKVSLRTQTNELSQKLNNTLHELEVSKAESERKLNFTCNRHLQELEEKEMKIQTLEKEKETRLKEEMLIKNLLFDCECNDSRDETTIPNLYEAIFRWKQEKNDEKEAAINDIVGVTIQMRSELENAEQRLQQCILERDKYAKFMQMNDSIFNKNLSNSDVFKNHQMEKGLSFSKEELNQNNNQSKYRQNNSTIIWNTNITDKDIGKGEIFVTPATSTDHMKLQESFPLSLALDQAATDSENTKKLHHQNEEVSPLLSNFHFNSDAFESHTANFIQNLEREDIISRIATLQFDNDALTELVTLCNSALSESTEQLRSVEDELEREVERREAIEKEMFELKQGLKGTNGNAIDEHECKEKQITNKCEKASHKITKEESALHEVETAWSKIAQIGISRENASLPDVVEFLIEKFNANSCSPSSIRDSANSIPLTSVSPHSCLNTPSNASSLMKPQPLSSSQTSFSTNFHFDSQTPSSGHLSTSGKPSTSPHTPTTPLHSMSPLGAQSPGITIAEVTPTLPSSFLSSAQQLLTPDGLSSLHHLPVSQPFHSPSNSLQAHQQHNKSTSSSFLSTPSPSPLPSFRTSKVQESDCAQAEFKNNMLPQEVNAEERTQSFSDQRHAALLKDYEKLKMQHKQLKDEIDQYCLLIVEMQSSLDMAKENESGYLNREAHLWAEIDNNKKKLALCKDKEQKAEHERLKWNAKQKDYLEREKQFKNEIASLKDDMEKKLLSINKLENQLDSVLEQFESALSEKKECELRAEQMEKENNELRKMMSELSAEITELDEWTKKKEERGERAWELEHSEKQKFRNETFGAESNRLIEDLHVSIAHLEKEKKELLTKLQRLNKESIEKEAEMRKRIDMLEMDLKFRMDEKMHLLAVSGIDEAEWNKEYASFCEDQQDDQAIPLKTSSQKHNKEYDHSEDLKSGDASLSLDQTTSSLQSNFMQQSFDTTNQSKSQKKQGTVRFVLDTKD